MYSVDLENSLISPDIVNLMSERCSVQLDIDQTRIKSAAIVAQDIDLGEVLTKAQIERARNPQNEEDDELLELIIPAWCFYTYSRCLSMNVGSFTDSGFVIEKEVLDAEEILWRTKKDAIVTATVYMDKVIEFLETETTSLDLPEVPLRIRTMGGQEHRGSN
jgi:hypothetical protein